MNFKNIFVSKNKKRYFLIFAATIILGISIAFFVLALCNKESNITPGPCTWCLGYPIGKTEAECLADWTPENCQGACISTGSSTFCGTLDATDAGTVESKTCWTCPDSSEVCRTACTMISVSENDAECIAQDPLNPHCDSLQVYDGACSTPPTFPPTQCSLTMTPDTGEAPLDVVINLTTQGSDFNEYQLDFGDGEQECNPINCPGDPAVLFGGVDINHRYDSPGSYAPQATLFQNGVFVAQCGGWENVDVAPTAPTNLRHTANTPGSIDWQWNAVDGADSYKVFHKYSETGFKEFPNYDYDVDGTAYHQTQFWFVFWFIQGWRDLDSPIILWNNPRTISVRACKESLCSGLTVATAANSVEDPNVISCSNIQNDRFTVNVGSDEHWGSQEFSYLNQGKSGVRLRIYKQSDGTGQQTSAWLPGSGILSNPAPYTFSGLSAGTTYDVCAQARNQDSDLNTPGDYRPGPTSNNWTCAQCTTTGAPPAISSIGFIKVQTPTGPIKLNVKALGDKDDDDIVRIMMPGGIIGLADMVGESERNDSPVKVYLGADPKLGVKYWRKLDD